MILAEPGNVFGFDRTSRQQVPELQDLVDQIHDEDWHECRTDDECLRLPATPITVTNPTMHQSYCGPVTVIAFTVTPWAYRHLVSSPWVDSRAAHLDIRCTTS